MSARAGFEYGERMRVPVALLASSLPLLALACADAPPPPVAPPTPTAPPPPASTTAPAPPPAPTFDRVARLDFNRVAAELDLPLFWVDDDASPGALDPAEIAVLWGFPGAATSTYVGADGAFTQAFRDAYERIAQVARDGYPIPAAPDEQRRVRAVLDELGQGRPSLLRSDFRAASAEDKAIVDHVLKAADAIERLYNRQLGVQGLDKEIPADDLASRALFRRNHGPYCRAPRTEKDPACRALARVVPRVSGLYPASLQTDAKFCEKLEGRPDAKALLGPFTVVVDAGGGKLAATPFGAYWKDDSAVVAAELEAAANAITSPGEAALKAYLLADAKAFKDDDWRPADEAWAKMTNENSRWYLRIAPDETYDDACDHKAGYQVSFARINQDSVEWQKKLDPVKNEMEDALASLAGAPYKSRKGKVSFHLPDFIDIVLNAGDARSPTGATAGESLPNWGPVANEGRGRTVVMTNIGVDRDSVAALKERTAAVLCKETFDRVSWDPKLSTMSTVLHEAAHNLGPAHEYKVRGKTDAQLLGGPLASMFEELKAQTSALYFTDWLVDKKLVDAATAERAHLREMLWAFGQMAEGMYGGDGKPKPYPQLAAIQLGSFVKAGAITWSADALAANGKDKGCLTILAAKMPTAIAALEKRVAGIKARGDKKDAVALREEHVDKKDEFATLRAVIQERWQRQPATSFVYAVER